MKKNDDFWLGVFEWFLGEVFLALVSSVVLHAVECDCVCARERH